jgi:uncharacterized protein YjiS (DUF1127 family)
MHIWFDAIARAAGIDAAPNHPVSHARPGKVRRNRAAPGIVRRILSDIGGAVPPHPFQDLSRRHRRRERIAELDALDDHILQDIGVNRRSIPELVDARLRLEAEADAADPRRAPDRSGFRAQPCEQPC